MAERVPAVYIMTNKENGTLYTGVTSNLIARVYQHKQSVVECFAKRYHCYSLVYYELFDDMYNAITREKQIKANSRAYKLELINSMNPAWKDLYDTLL